MAAAAPALFQFSSPGSDASSSSENIAITRVHGVPDRLLALRLSTLLATALYYSEERSEGGELPQIARDLMDVVTQLVDGNNGSADDASSGTSSWGRGFQARVVEMLADMMIRADESSSHGNTRQEEEGKGELLLRVLLNSGAVDALLQYLASSKPTSATLIQSAFTMR